MSVSPCRPSGARDENVTFLLTPGALFVVGLFRLFDGFRRDYDQACLDAAQEAIRSRLGEAASHGVMSDALLLDNELRMRTRGCIDFMPQGAAAASPDEHSIARMIAALQARGYRHAVECALDLDVVQSKTMILLADRLAARLRAAGLVLPFAARPPARPSQPGPATGLRLV